MAKGEGVLSTSGEKIEGTLGESARRGKREFTVSLPNCTVQKNPPERMRHGPSDEERNGGFA